jgi:hypothetical protein
MCVSMEKQHITLYFIWKIIQTQLSLEFYLLTKKLYLLLFSTNNPLKHLFFNYITYIRFNFANIINKNYLIRNTKINEINLVIIIH